LIPYAVWGKVDDTSVSGISDCINEFTNTVYCTSLGYPTPHVWAPPAPSTTFGFDSFHSSLFILFEIVSLQGWIDVLNVTTSITGAGLQPQTNAAEANAIFSSFINLWVL
jgi:voltage-dependent calcium channel